MIDASIYQQARQALKESNQELLQLIDALPEMAWVANQKGKVQYFNQHWYTYTGMKPAQTEGWVNVLHPEDSSQVIAAWNKALETGHYHIECRIRSRIDGSYRWFLEQGVPIWIENDQFLLWIGTYTDIDEQKQDLEP